MAVTVNFSRHRFDDGNLSVAMDPPVAIGGWSILFQVQKSFGGLSGLITKSVSSGLNAASGITITNSGQGQFNVQINSVDTSGMDFGNYAFQCVRNNSGVQTVISEGFMTVSPSIAETY